MTKVSFTTKSGKKVSFNTKSKKPSSKSKSINKTSTKSKSMAAKGTTTKTKKRKAADQFTKYYNKTEKAIGASAIAKRIMDLIGVPEPYNSTTQVIVGAGRGGIPGGLGTLLVNSSFLEAALGTGQGAISGASQGFRDSI